jgi:hypothetical protein
LDGGAKVTVVDVWKKERKKERVEKEKFDALEVVEEDHIIKSE